MEIKIIVNEIEEVREEEIEMEMNEIGSKKRMSIDVEIDERREERGKRKDGKGGMRENMEKDFKRCLNERKEGRGNEKVEDLIELKRMRNIIKKMREDDEEREKDERSGGKRNVKEMINWGGLNKWKELRIRGDIERKKEMLKIGKEEGMVGNIKCEWKGFIRIGGILKIEINGGKRKGGKRGLDESGRKEKYMRINGRKEECKIMEGLIKDNIENRIEGLRVGGIEKIGGDLNKIGIERKLVKIIEKIEDGRRWKEKEIEKNEVNLGDNMNIGILNKVMDGFEEMKREIREEKRKEGIEMIFGGERKKDRRDEIIGMISEEENNRRKMERELRKKRKENEEKGRIIGEKRIKEEKSIEIIGIEWIDNDIEIIKEWIEEGGIGIEWRKGIDEKDDRKGIEDIRGKLIKGREGNDIVEKKERILDERFKKRIIKVIEGKGVEIIGYVKRKVGENEEKEEN